MSIIQFENVSKQFTLHRNRPRSFQELFLSFIRRERPALEKYWALRDVSFEIEPGEVVGIVGANGVGKSTVLKLMSRIIEPTSGQICVDGKIGALLELGAGFHPDLTGRENIYLNGSILGFNRAYMDRIFDNIVYFSEMARFIDVPVKHYSSGMYMRLAFSIAIHAEPDILLVDEVLAVGDQAFQFRCLDRIHGMKRQGVTIVLVTHSMDMVRDMCSRAIWLDDGVIQAEGAVEQVLERYTAQVLSHDQVVLEQAEDERRQDEIEILTGEASPEEDDASDDEPDWRWGSGESEIVDVQFLNDAGQESRAFKTGEPFVARIHYLAHQKIEEPLFGVALHHASGFHLSGPNTGFSDYTIEAIDGRGYVDFSIPSLPLLAGTYLFSAAIYDAEGQQAFDHHHMAYTFRVVPCPEVKEQYGTLHIASRWRLGNASTAETVYSGGEHTGERDD
jgi:lipopolysaccharide transport system ATP-binding protein